MPLSYDANKYGPLAFPYLAFALDYCESYNESLKGVARIPSFCTGWESVQRLLSSM